MISGICIAIMIAMFLGIVMWAYSDRRRADFSDAAQLPLYDENIVHNPSEPRL